MRLQPSAWASSTSRIQTRRLGAFLLEKLRRPVEQATDRPGLLRAHGLHSQEELTTESQRTQRKTQRRNTKNALLIPLHFLIVLCVFSCLCDSVVNSLFLRLSQALFLVEVAQRLDQFAQVAGDDGVELVQVQVDAVIGDAVLREIVGADAFAAVAGADQGAPLLGPFAGAVSAAAVRRGGCAGYAWPGRSSCAGCARPGT